jgi:flagellar basal-body rod modification protein FlgD
MTTSAVSDLFSQLGLASAKPARKQELGQDDFLRLMTEQLKNQDPLKPMESTQFLAQLAQFSTVQGIESLNSSFASLSGSLSSNQALQGASLVGQRVLVPSDTAALGATGILEGAVDVPAGAGSVTVDIVDSSGATVRTIDLGAQSQGLAHFAWDGNDAAGARAPAGSYALRAHGNLGGRALSLDALAIGRVDSVTLNGADGLILNLAGMSPVAFNQVRQIMAASSP